MGQSQYAQNNIQNEVVQRMRDFGSVARNAGLKLSLAGAVGAMAASLMVLPNPTAGIALVTAAKYIGAFGATAGAIGVASALVGQKRQ